MPRIFTDGYVEPILWGIRLGYTLAEIADGCEIDIATVIDVLESRSRVRFPTTPFAMPAIPRSLDIWERAG